MIKEGSSHSDGSYPTQSGDQSGGPDRPIVSIHPLSQRTSQHMPSDKRPASIDQRTRGLQDSVSVSSTVDYGLPRYSSRGGYLAFLCQFVIKQGCSGGGVQSSPNFFQLFVHCSEAGRYALPDTGSISNISMSYQDRNSEDHLESGSLIDMSNFYFHVLLHPKSYQFVCFQVRSRIFQFWAFLKLSLFAFNRMTAGPHVFKPTFIPDPRIHRRLSEAVGHDFD